MALSLTFKRFQRLLNQENVEDEALCAAVHPELLSFRSNVLSDMPAEDGYRKIWELADATSKTKHEIRPRSRRDTRSGSTPYTTRAENLKKNRVARQDSEAIFFHLLLGEEDQSYADEIAECLFGAPFYDHFEQKLRKEGIEVPRRGTGRETFQFGNIQLRLVADSDADIVSVPTPNRDLLFENGKIKPLEALRWQNGVSHSYGRDGQAREIIDWARGPETEAAQADNRAAVRLLTGPGGAGKSRLAWDVAKQLRRRNWETLFLPARINAPEIIDKLQAGGTGTLLVVDYPEERPKLVRALFDAIDEDKHYAVPIRILLVSRESEETWRKSTDRPLRRLETTSLELHALLDEDDAIELIESALMDLRSTEVVSEDERSAASAWLQRDPMHRLPLNALAAAVYAFVEPGRAFTLEARDILKALVNIELSRTRRYSVRDLATSLQQENRYALERLLALGLLSGRGVSEDALYALGDQGVVVGTSGHDLVKRVSRTPYWGSASDDQGKGVLRRIEPDIVAAAYLAEALLAEPIPQELSAWMACTVRHAGSGFLSVLSRLCFDLASYKLDVSRKLEALMIEMLESSPDVETGFLGSALGETTAFSAKTATVLLSRALAESDSQLRRTTLLNRLSDCLSDLGRHGEALEAAQESLAIGRTSTATDPGALHQNVVVPLNGMARALHGVGRREEALEQAQRAAKLCRELSRSMPDAFLPTLAMSLNNLANALSDMGRHEEGLDVARETVNIDRKLAALKPDVFRPNLAMSLHNLADTLCDLGRSEEGLGLVQEAVAIRRDLSAARPDAFRADLAMSLNTLANILSNLRQREKALETAQETAEIYDELEAALPGVFRHHLAMSLTNLSSRLSEVGRPLESLEPAQKATKTYRRLAAEMPAAFSEQLAKSLDVLARMLSQVGRHKEALAAAEEATDIYRDLAGKRPSSFRRGFAGSLENFALGLFRSGRLERAVALAREAEEIYRELVIARPDVFRRKLSGLLCNLANMLSDLQRYREALDVARESVEIERGLAESEPDALSSGLAASLNNLGQALDGLERHGEAFEAFQEAVNIYRALASAAPDVFCHNLSVLLYNLANRLTDLGRRPEALETAKEAVSTLRPYFLQLPQGHAQLMLNLYRAYVDKCRRFDAKPDVNLLQPIVEMFERLERREE